MLITLNVILQCFKTWKNRNRSRKKRRGEKRKQERWRNTRLCPGVRCSGVQFLRCLRIGHRYQMAETWWLQQLYDILHGELEAESKTVKEKHSPVLKCWQEDSISPDALGFSKFKIKVDQSPRQFGYLRNMVKFGRKAPPIKINSFFKLAKIFWFAE